ncbi:hypothetical protein [Mastigocladopsis repens]|uniref:hypothetical protein n=1 Tax=Mastigocladopsis repens TaxID=221287 RepID=UPI0002D9D063|nr:hypothetical protein [Mastigocladopsis repens]
MPLSRESASTINVYNGSSPNNDYKVISKTLSQDGILVSENATGYRFFSFQLIGIFDYSATISLEVSNDSINWIPQTFAFYNPDYSSQIAFLEQVRYPGFCYTNIKASYLRLVVSNYNEAGEIQAFCYLSKESFEDLGQEAIYNNAIVQTIQNLIQQVNSQSVTLSYLAKPYDYYSAYPNSGLNTVFFEKNFPDPKFSYADVYIKFLDFVGSFVCEIQYSSGDWQPISFYQISPSIEVVTSATQEGNYIIIFPFTNNNIRFRIDSYSSGQIGASVSFAEGSLPQQVIYLTKLIGLLKDLQQRFTPKTRIPTLIQSSSAGNTPDNVVSLSIANRGSEPGLVLDILLAPGDSLSWEAPDGDTLASIPYDATNTTFLISALV